MEALQHHAPYVGSLFLGTLFYILYGLLKFQKSKKGRKWTLKEWLRLNGIATAMGVVASLITYAILASSTDSVSHERCILIGLGADMLAKGLVAKAEK